jgi:hypothetical protein
MDVEAVLQLGTTPLTQDDERDRALIDRCVLTFGFPPVEDEAISEALELASRRGAVPLGPARPVTVGDVAELSIEIHARNLRRQSLAEVDIDRMLANRQTVEGLGEHGVRRATRRRSKAGLDDLLVDGGVGKTEVTDAVAVDASEELSLPELEREVLRSIDRIGLLEVVERKLSPRLYLQDERRARWPLARFHASYLDHDAHLATYRARILGGASRYEALEREASLRFIAADVAEHPTGPRWLPQYRLQASLRAVLLNELRDEIRRRRKGVERTVGDLLAAKELEEHTFRLFEVAAAGWDGRPTPQVVVFLHQLVDHLETHGAHASLREFEDERRERSGEGPRAVESRLLSALGRWSCSLVDFRWPRWVEDGPPVELKDPREFTDPAYDRLFAEYQTWLEGARTPPGGQEGSVDPLAHDGLRGAFIDAMGQTRDPLDGERVAAIVLTQSLGIGRAQQLHPHRWTDSARSHAIKRFCQRGGLPDILHRHVFQNGRNDGRGCPCSMSPGAAARDLGGGGL